MYVLRSYGSNQDSLLRRQGRRVLPPDEERDDEIPEGLRQDYEGATPVQRTGEVTR